MKSPSLTQSLGQYMRLEQKLTPQLIQSLNILQLNSMALENCIAEELEKNCALEVEEREDSSGADGDASPVDGDAELSRLSPEDQSGAQDTESERQRPDGNGEVASFEHLDRLTREYGGDTFSSTAYQGRRSGADGDRDAKQDAMANLASRPEGLAEHLLTQWHTLDMDETSRRIGETIIYNLEDDGFLKVNLEEIAAKVRPPATLVQVEQVLPRVQRLDPVGVAARDYQECLLLQLEAQPGDNRIETELVRNHMRDVVRKRYPAIAKATGYSIGEITEAVKAMQSSLYLHPGYLVIEPVNRPIRPDVIIDYADVGQGFEVWLARSSDPRLRISQSAMDMLRDKKSGSEVRSFVRKHVESASSLIDAIRFRRERLLAVGERIAEHQHEFFETGPEALKVLRMNDLARDLECDPSTVSRTVAGKYVQTPRGIYPMRFFFSGGTETADGESTSWDSVKASVKRIVDEEDKSKPLNDDQIAALLRKKGVEISRRTVAKYRQQLDIPTARQRREYV